MHCEVDQTQFMPKNILAYGTGNLDVEPNFAAIEAWNAASVYQRAIALMGRQIDGGE
jgi:membrane-bound lytic murein transglycosylase B